MTSRRSRRVLWALSVASVVLLSCATPGPARHRGQGPQPLEPLLLFGSPEFHLEATEGGQVFVVTEGDNGVGLERREVDSYEEFRTLYQADDAEPLPPELPTEGLMINGWRGQECMRAAHVCGTAPAEPLHGLPPVQVLLRFGAKALR